MHTNHFTYNKVVLSYNQTDQLWPPPDIANSINCTILLLLSGPASVVPLSKLSDASLYWTASATPGSRSNRILTVCTATVTDCIVTLSCSTVRPANSGSLPASVAQLMKVILHNINSIL